MAFVTDKQTLDDLGIFGKPGSESVFALFNRTCTAGGAAILEEMFTYPLSDRMAINERIQIFQQFAGLQMAFPFNAELFGLVEHYLQHTDERTKLSNEQYTLIKKILHFVSSDTEYKLLKKGVTSLREILLELWDFLQHVPCNESAAFNNEKENMLALLKQEPFYALVQQKKNSSISPVQITEYDTLFRFKQRSVIRQVLQFIYAIDVYIAVGKVAHEKQLCFPRALPGKTGGLTLRNTWHPLLKKPVANSIDLAPGKNMVFLTGANMAGKSTFMKTLGIAVFLAHAGFPVPARHMDFTVMDGLFTTINLPDNLGIGASHFYTEVLRVKKVAKELALSKNLLIIFDELFRGTNVKDAYEATVAVMAAFAQKPSSLFVVSTHIIEAGEILKDTCNNIRFLFLPTQMKGTVPVYTYTLENGITSDRHGMVIIRNEGILDILKAPEKQVIS